MAAAAPSERAREAHGLFEARSYAECLAVLESLQRDRPNDEKVAENAAIVRFYQGGQASYSALSAELLRLKETCEKHRQTPDEVAGSALLCYNAAASLFAQRQFLGAYTILERLFNIISMIEESVARRICLLLLDIYMTADMSDRATKVVAFLEKGLPPQEKKAAAETRAAPSNSPDSDSEGEGEAAVTNEADALRVLLQQCKARMSITAVTKASKREVKTALNVSSKSVPALFVKAHVEYARRNHRKAVRLLHTIPKSQTMVCGQSVPVLYFNNLGCIHLQLSKPQLAAYYFTRALEANEREAGRLGGTPREWRLADCRAALLRNLALATVMGGGAAETLEAAANAFHAAAALESYTPATWLRLAQCMLTRPLQTCEPLVMSVGQGSVRKAVPVRPRSPSLPAATLVAAAQCLENALLHDPRKAGGEPSESALRVRVYALVHLAYVRLGLDDHPAALDAATRALAEPTSPPIVRTHAHLYAAEALVLLHRTPEALSHLQPEVGMEDFALTHQPAPDGSASSAKAVLLMNLAAAHSLRDDLQGARVCLEQACQLPLSGVHRSAALLQTAYLMLRRGAHKEALDCLRLQRLPR